MTTAQPDLDPKKRFFIIKSPEPTPWRLFRLLKRIAPKDGSAFMISVPGVAHAMGRTEEWVRITKNDLVILGHLEKTLRFDKSGAQMRSLYRIVRKP